MSLLEYFKKLNIDMQLIRPDIKTLTQVYTSHLYNIPYNNCALYIAGKQATQNRISNKITEDDLFERLIRQKRGGYCYETSELLYHALKYIGFTVARISAYVLLCPAIDEIEQIQKRKEPSTHNLLIVYIDDTIWLLDPGFATGSLHCPLQVIIGENIIEVSQKNLCFRLTKLPKENYFSGEYRLDFRRCYQTEWLSLYQFEFVCIDYTTTEELNHKLYHYPQHIPIRDGFFLCFGISENNIGHEIKSNESGQLIYSKYLADRVEKEIISWKDLPLLQQTLFSINPYPKLMEMCTEMD